MFMVRLNNKSPNSRNLEKIANFSNPTLSDRSYKPNQDSHEFKWTVKRFRDDDTDAIMENCLPYAMTQHPGSTVLGEYNPPSHSGKLDITKPNYSDTRIHELKHAKHGKN